MRAWWPLAALGIALVLLLPIAQACSTSPGPYQHVRLQIEESGVRVLDLPTDLQVGPNDLCGYTALPELLFDGERAAWKSQQTLHVVDVRTGARSTYVDAMVTGKTVAILDRQDPGHVRLLDLDDNTTRDVDAAENEAFFGNVAGAVLARGFNGTTTWLAVLDPETATWSRFAGPAPYNAKAGNSGWLVYRAGNDGVMVVDLREGTRSALATAGSPVGVLGDRLYLVGPYTASQTGTPGTATPVSSSSARGSQEAWSIRLPDGDERQEGPLPTYRTVGERTARFVVGSGATQTSTAGPVSTTPLGTTSGSMASPGDPDDVLDIPMPALGAGLATFALAAAVRRRL